ncbi:MAG TPA: SRPBCC family protein [Cyclobacteriaceae bacterium]|nr:SRPBCC family protein [Cyclobacteriaceae bacterium]
MAQKNNKTQLTVEPGKQELIVVREFDAPRELVFKAFTDKKLVAKWLSPKKLKIKIHKFEPRTGGSWHYSHIDENGNEYSFHGVNHDVTAPERIIQTFEFDGLPEKGHVTLETSRFEELPGNRTRLVNLTVFQTVADRDGMVAAGMEGGMNEAYDQLDALLAS